ncbi:ABC transporter permease [Flavobacterium arcticum]|uniref:ABC transporter permease n=1 Tax=Flavobacterium arcticum TaxID=1784713 RepID=A0A345HET7_9FLAO|nr:ABC transporter permease [Flavobacterium arcticum]AXG75097.1 ABC transporter permease [Flavobacterium arcticum]KAF2511124.1 ABC transporter permease [Flavobacterium arcticum]
MKRLLNIELQKLWQNTSSKVLIITYFVLLSFIALLASVNFKIIGIDFRLADQGIFNFPYIWHFNTYIADTLKFFLALIVVSMMSNEYTYGTLKQNLIDGMSKKEFIQSKFLTVLVFALGSTLFIFFMSLILGYSFSSYTEASIVFSDLGYISSYFLKLTAFFSFCLFAGMLVKRSAFAIGFVFLWYIVEGLLFLLLRWMIIKDSVITNNIVQFFPLQSISSLIKEPVSRFQAYKAIENLNNGGIVTEKFYGTHWYEFAIAIFWTAFFIFMSYRILKKRDL